MEIVFMGSPDFSIPVLEKLHQNKQITIKSVISQPDRPRGRGQELQPTPVKKRAEQLGLKVITTDDINQQEYVKFLEHLAPRLIVVAAFGQILSSEILGIPEIGCINLHASLLPEYRGASPIHRAIIEGQTATGVTIMFMDRGMDTGDIIRQKKVTINKDDTVGDLHDRLARVGAVLMEKTLLDMDKGDYTRKPQQEKQATYAHKLNKKTGLIDWNDTSKNIYNLVRGLNPWPVAYTFLDGDRIKIWEVDVVENKLEGEGQPGEIIQVSSGNLLVQTGSGLLAVKQLQPPGKKKMSVVDYLNGYQIEKGQVFGSKVN